jgi:hypothetical protein
VKEAAKPLFSFKNEKEALPPLSLYGFTVSPSQSRIPPSRL